MTFFRKFAFSAFLLVCVSLVRGPMLQAQLRTVIPDSRLTFTTIDVPGAASTNVYGINSAGHMTGNYSTAIGSPSRGFSLAGGAFSLFDYPGGDDTLAFGINDSDLISGGSSVDNFSGIVSFLYDGTNFTTIQAPGASITWANGINNAGNVVGGYGSGSEQAFVLVGQHFKTISPPGEYLNIFANGINNLRQIVGAGDDTGFFYSHGTFRKIVVPGASVTKPLGINDNGIIVGWYEKGPPYAIHGFVLVHGKYLTLDYPDATFTGAVGINNLGQIVGSYGLGDNSNHGFVTSPVTAADFGHSKGFL